mmetsp:Transcript_9645/g.29746  ORF Transcript_9645/g.29746 Transcript_9645/m.29746 type:complete len:208 (+) Transcript_9645:334-957(+)
MNTTHPSLTSWFRNFPVPTVLIATLSPIRYRALLQAYCTVIGQRSIRIRPSPLLCRPLRPRRHGTQPVRPSGLPNALQPSTRRLSHPNVWPPNRARCSRSWRTANVRTFSRRGMHATAAPTWNRPACVSLSTFSDRWSVSCWSPATRAPTRSRSSNSSMILPSHLVRCGRSVSTLTCISITCWCTTVVVRMPRHRRTAPPSRVKPSR